MKTNRTSYQYNKIPLFLLSEIIKDNYGVADYSSEETIKQYINGKSISGFEIIKTVMKNAVGINRERK